MFENPLKSDASFDSNLQKPICSNLHFEDEDSRSITSERDAARSSFKRVRKNTCGECGERAVSNEAERSIIQDIVTAVIVDNDAAEPLFLRMRRIDEKLGI
ncbi:unnamed protein product [Arabidopsis thaliana]|uniref:Uncharacterized protein n=1 Tax=Arabidopsis thaliana TaxID=3702 RepID=A0A5S9XZQ5_ARATH|nr:unnamed protein product [Arabidopsis thaliana]